MRAPPKAITSPHDRADRGEQHALLQDQLLHIGELRAKRHAQSDLARASGDDVRHHTIDADRRENEREDTETAERDRGHARGKERGAHVFRQRLCCVNRERRIELLHFGAQGAQHRRGSPRVRAMSVTAPL